MIIEKQDNCKLFASTSYSPAQQLEKSERYRFLVSIQKAKNLLFRGRQEKCDKKHVECWNEERGTSFKNKQYPIPHAETIEWINVSLSTILVKKFQFVIGEIFAETGKSCSHRITTKYFKCFRFLYQKWCKLIWWYIVKSRRS